MVETSTFKFFGREPANFEYLLACAYLAIIPVLGLDPLDLVLSR